MVRGEAPLVGVLALQGDFARHAASLRAAGARVRRVVTPGDLEGCTGLVLPGGESTTLMHLAREGGLVEPLKNFARRGAVMGTCAGLIILARRIVDSSMETLALLDITAERNGFGRQAESFIDTVHVELDGTALDLEGVFIRAPRIRDLGKEMDVLGRWRDEPVMVRHGRLLALTFHPELTRDVTVHRYFVSRMAADGARRQGAA